MKIIIVGGTGTIGKIVTECFSQEHEVITVGSKSGAIKADITSIASIEALFKKIGNFDALISITGSAHFGSLQQMTTELFLKGINNKLMGQINLVLIGQHHINPQGSFTLTSGILADEPIMNGVNLSTVNGGINAFVKAASIELKHGVRINAVSPGVVEASPKWHSFFPGHIPVSMDRVEAAYQKAVLGAQTGQVINVF